MHACKLSCMQQMNLLCAEVRVGNKTKDTKDCCVYVWGGGTWILTSGTHISRSYHEGRFQAVTQLESAWAKLYGSIRQGEEISNANSLYANFDISFTMDFCIHYDFKILHYNIHSDCQASLVDTEAPRQRCVPGSCYAHPYRSWYISDF